MHGIGLPRKSAPSGATKRIRVRDIVTLLRAGMTGVALGGIFFGGLWWTVRLALSASTPGLWFLVSLLLRMSVLMAGIYFVGARHWDRLAACLVGLVMGRLIVTWLTQLPARRRRLQAAQFGHAP